MAELTRIHGDEDIRPGKNTSGSTASKGMPLVVKALPTVPNEVTLATAATDIPYGVAMADAADGTYCDVQIRGQAIVLAGGVVAVGANVTADATSRFVTAAANEKVWGVALTLGATAGLMLVELCGPTGGSPTHA